LAGTVGQGLADDGVRLGEAVALPSEAALDEPSQDAWGLAGERVGEVLVVARSLERRGPRHHANAAPDAGVPAADLGQGVGLQPEGVCGVEAPGIFPHSAGA